MTGSREGTGVGRARVAAALLLAACVGWGCGLGEDPDPVPSEWTAEALGTIPWEVEGAGAVERVAVGPGARIYLVREGEELVRVHGAGGEPTAPVTSGEEEDGFRSVTEVGLTGDSLYVLDGDRSRVELFSPAGEPLGSWTWRPRSFTGASGGVTVFVPGIPRTFVLRADGTALVRPNVAGTGPRPPESPGLVRWARRVPLLHMDRRAVVQDTVVWEELGGSILFLPHRGDTLRVPVPFEDGPLFELMPDGSGVVVVERRLPSDSAADYTVSLVEPGRDTAWIRSLPYSPRDLDAASVRRVLGASLAPGPGGEPPDSGLVAEVESALRAIDALPAVWPPVSRVAGGQDGTVWIGREEAGDSTVWQVLDSRGRLAGWVDLPRGWEVLAARGDLLVARAPEGPDGARLVVNRVTR